MKKKLWIILAALLTLPMVMAACQQTPQSAETTAEEYASASLPETEEETEPATEPATNAETEAELPAPGSVELTSDVTIYCPFDRNRTLNKIAKNLADTIQAKTGIRLKVVYGGDEPVAPSDSEIILGYDNTREAAVSAYRATPVGGYGIYTEGKSVILTAWDNDDIQSAATLFLENCLVQTGDRWYMLPQSVAADAEEPAAAALSAYRFVYAADADENFINVFIPNLQAYVLNTYGVRISAVSDAEAPTDYELVLGQTNRTTDEVKPFLEGDTALLPRQRAVIPSGSRFFILADNETGISMGIAHILNRLETHLIGQGTVLHAIAPVSLATGGEVYVNAPSSTEDKAELAEGAELRIMSYNILNQDYVPDNPLSPERGRWFTDILSYYMPDVVGVQEANLAWHQSFDVYLSLSGIYRPACRYHDGVHTAQTTFLYNSLTVKLIEEYVVHYTDWEDSDIRVVSIAVFETLADGKRFVMTNTHPAPHAQHYSDHMVELNRILTAELAKYEGLPVIMTGDFNTRENQEEYTTLTTTQGVRDARYDEGVELVRDVRTYTVLPDGEAVGGSIIQAANNNIDHIFINSKVQAKLFNVVIDHGVTDLSDHLPIYTDIAFK